MTEDEVIELIVSFIEKQFPKDCPNCGRTYLFLADYLQHTTRIGDPISYDAVAEDWRPENPIGNAQKRYHGPGDTQ